MPRDQEQNPKSKSELEVVSGGPIDDLDNPGETPDKETPAGAVARFLSGNLQLSASRLTLTGFILWVGFIGWIFLQDNGSGKFILPYGFLLFALKAALFTGFVIAGILMSVGAHALHAWVERLRRKPPAAQTEAGRNLLSPPQPDKIEVDKSKSPVSAKTSSRQE